MVAPDIIIRASVSDETAKGLKSVEKSATATFDEIQHEAGRKLKEQMAGGHKESHFGRIFSDASTTGLGTLERGLLSGLGDKLGIAMELGGAAVAGKFLEDMTGKLLAFKNKLHETGQDGYQIAIALGESVPILGSIVTAGQNIREIFTGEKQGLQDQEELLKIINEGQERHLRAALSLEQTHRNDLDVLKAMAREDVGVGLRGISVDRYAITSDIAAARDEAAKKKADADAALQQDAGIKKASDALADFQKKGGNRAYELQQSLAAGGITLGKNRETIIDPNGIGDLFYHQKTNELRSLLEQQDQFNANLKSATADATKTRNSAYANADAQLQQRTKTDHDKLNKVVELQNNQRLQLESESQSASYEQTVSSAEAKQNAVNGFAAEARRQQINADAKKASDDAASAAESRQNATGDWMEKLTIEWQLIKTLSAIEKTRLADIATANKEAAAEQSKANYENTQSQIEAQVNFSAEYLRSVGRGYDAEHVLRQQALQRKLDDIDFAAQEEIKKNNANQDAINAAAKAKKDQLNTQFNETERQAGETRREGQVGVAKDLIQGRIDELQGEAKAGSVAAAIEARRLAITEKFIERREHLNQLIRDPNTTEAEKKLAQQELGRLPKDQALEEKMAGFAGGAPLPGLTISATSSGRAARETEKNSEFGILTREMQNSTSATREDIAVTKQLLDAIRKLLQQNEPTGRPGRPY